MILAYTREKHEYFMRKEGREEGSEITSSLFDILLDNNRIEDAKKAAKDKDYRNQLLEEFGLIDEENIG